MWEKIKNFFKWIADHTGISWIARKISSGWKWLFGGKANTTQQNTSQHEERSDNEKQEPTQANDQSKDHTTPKTLDNEVNPDQPTPTTIPDKPQRPVINTSETNIKPTGDYPIPNLQNANSKTRASYEGKLEIINNELRLCFKKPLKYKGDYIYIKCGEDEYRIPYTNNSLESMLVESILKKNRDGRYVNGNIILVEGRIKYVEGMLGLKDGVEEVKVDRISNKPFETVMLEQPNPNGTSHNVTQQTVNNEEVTTESEKFHDAEDDGVTQPTPSAVPNKSQGNSIVINGVVIPEGAKLKFFPETSDFLSRASLEREMLFCKVAPNSLLTQPIAEQAADNDHSR